ncbi:Hypothetical predicted protein [Cloeon dipterum]|uniref:Bee-milk protein n=1 Tax=Cloeon dipterum TaxID=197152 RepID=A0A8S1CEJ3_9INSE|nr:Hypothetical predicted protein [Cloeon dipterum]
MIRICVMLGLTAACFAVRINPVLTIKNGKQPQCIAASKEKIFLAYQAGQKVLGWLPTFPLIATSGPNFWPSTKPESAGLCDTIYDVKGLEIDHTGNLWVLDDGGTSICFPKIIIFNPDNYKEIYHCQFPSAVVSSSSSNNRKLRGLFLDCFRADKCFAYIAYSGSNTIVVFDKSTGQIGRVEVQGTKIFAIALSALKKKLYISGYQSGALFSVSVAEIRAGKKSVKPTFEGNMNDWCSEMVMDDATGVLYLELKNSLVVYWNTNTPFQLVKVDFQEKYGRSKFSFAKGISGSIWIMQYKTSEKKSILYSAVVETESNTRFTTTVSGANTETDTKKRDEVFPATEIISVNTSTKNSENNEKGGTGTLIVAITCFIIFSIMSVGISYLAWSRIVKKKRRFSIPR